MEKRYKLQIEEERRHDGHALIFLGIVVSNPRFPSFRHLKIDRSFEPASGKSTIVSFSSGKNVEKESTTIAPRQKRKNRKSRCTEIHLYPWFPTSVVTPHRGSGGIRE